MEASWRLGFPGFGGKSGWDKGVPTDSQSTGPLAATKFSSGKERFPVLKSISALSCPQFPRGLDSASVPRSPSARCAFLSVHTWYSCPWLENMQKVMGAQICPSSVQTCPTIHISHRIRRSLLRVNPPTLKTLASYSVKMGQVTLLIQRRGCSLQLSLWKDPLLSQKILGNLLFYRWE